MIPNDLCFTQSSPEKQNQEEMYLYVERERRMAGDLLLELALKILEAEKSHNREIPRLVLYTLVNQENQ